MKEKRSTAEVEGDIVRKLKFLGFRLNANTAYYSEHTIPTVKHSSDRFMLCGCFFQQRQGRWSELMGRWMEPNTGKSWNKTLQKSRLACKRLKTGWNGLDQSIVMYSNDDPQHSKIKLRICGKTCKLVFTDGLHPV